MNAQPKITDTEAPAEYQAQILLNQLIGDVEQRFWNERARLFRDHCAEKAEIEGDYNALSAADFLNKWLI